jgi:threonyl-tRNA synthetase
VGDKEMEEGKVALRRRDKGDMGAVSADEFIAAVLDDIANKTAF